VTGKVGEFCYRRAVGTLVIVIGFEIKINCIFVFGGPWLWWTKL